MKEKLGLPIKDVILRNRKKETFCWIKNTFSLSDWDAVKLLVVWFKESRNNPILSRLPRSNADRPGTGT